MFVPNVRTVYGSAHQVVTLSARGCAPWQKMKFSTIVYITKTQMKAIDQPTQRCHDGTTDTNTSACIARFIEQKLGCNAMTLGSQHSSTSKCTTRTQLLALANLSKTFERSDGNDIADMTGCLSACKKDQFSIIADPVVTETAYKEWGEVPCQLHLQFRILDNSFKVEEQYELYGMDSFIADVGGYMGLLLGISLLSIYRVVEHSTKKFFGRTRHGKIIIE